jgi:hypothetical protein
LSCKRQSLLRSNESRKEKTVLLIFSNFHLISVHLRNHFGKSTSMMCSLFLLIFHGIFLQNCTSCSSSPVLKRLQWDEFLFFSIFLQ